MLQKIGCYCSFCSSVESFWHDAWRFCEITLQPTPQSEKGLKDINESVQEQEQLRPSFKIKFKYEVYETRCCHSRNISFVEIVRCVLESGICFERRELLLITSTATVQLFPYKCNVLLFELFSALRFNIPVPEMVRQCMSCLPVQRLVWWLAWSKSPGPMKVTSTLSPYSCTVLSISFVQ